VKDIKLDGVRPSPHGRGSQGSINVGYLATVGKLTGPNLGRLLHPPKQAAVAVIAHAGESHNLAQRIAHIGPPTRSY